MKITNKFTPRYLFLAVFLGLAAIPARTQPNWSVVSTDYEFTMTVTGIANIDCLQSLDTNDIIAAFIGDEVRGVQPLREFYNGYNFAFMIVYDNTFSGNPIHFKIYDASEDRVIDALGSITFQENQNIGSTELPHFFQNEPGINLIVPNTYSIPRQLKAFESAITLSAWNELGEATNVVYSWITDAAGMDNGWFTIDGNQLLINVNATGIQDDTLNLHLRATPQDGCSLDYAFHLLLTDPVTATTDPNISEKLMIYPNPTHGILHWRSSFPFEKIQVNDLQGRLIYQSTLEMPTSVDLSFLVPGTYVVRMVKEDRSECTLFVKE